MQIALWCLGKSQPAYIREGLEVFKKRLGHYTRFDIEEYQLGKRERHNPVKEGAFIISKLKPSDYLILLDERGKDYTSVKFAEKINSLQLGGPKRVVFLIGGAHGFSDALYTRANEKLSLSKMTLSHQLIRLVFVEQLYRGFTILRNEPYHNE